MKKKYIVLLSLIILLGIGWFVFNTSLVKSANNITLSDNKLSDIDDGLYTGEYILMPVKVSAQVEVKTHKIEKFPLILVGTEFWKGLFEWIRSTVLLANNNVNAEDLDLVHLVDTEDEVLAILNDFYNEYNLSPNF